jgi:hypothetical protein
MGMVWFRFTPPRWVRSQESGIQYRTTVTGTNMSSSTSLVFGIYTYEGMERMLRQATVLPL